MGVSASHPKSEMNGRRGFGVIIVLVSALFFSTAGVFTKGIASDAWTIIAWRAVFAAILGIGYLVVTGSLRHEWRQMGWSSVAVSIVYASGTAAFIPAFKLTSIANVVLIWGTGPLVAAAIAWLWFREEMPKRFFLACLMVCIGVVIITFGSFGGVNQFGDMLALWMTVMMAIMMAIYRRYPQTPAVLPIIIGGIILVPAGFMVTTPLAASGVQIALCGGFALTFLVASVTLAIGSRHLAPGETALIGLSEIPYAILLAGLIIGTIPTAETVIGGAFVLTAVIWYQMTNFKTYPPPA